MTAVAVAGLLAAVPATADASRFLSRSQAAKATKRVALSITLGTTATARCWPTGRRHTQRNLRYRWRVWDCGWTARVSRSDGAVDDCNGKLRITGKRGGSTPNTLRAMSCVRVTGPNTGPAPGPAPAPAPDPDPTGLTARQKQMIEQAISYGIGYANQLIGVTFSGGGFYYGQMNRPDCVLINVTKVRCPIYFWWESQDQDSDFYWHITREIFRASVFVEDLGTSVGLNSSIEPQGILSYAPNNPYKWLCSNWYSGLPACPTERVPIQYPTSGPPFPNPH